MVSVDIGACAFQLFAERPVQVGHGIDFLDLSAVEPYCDANALAGFPAQRVSAKPVDLARSEGLKVNDRIGWRIHDAKVLSRHSECINRESSGLNKNERQVTR